MDESKVALLTAGQREALRLLFQRKTAGEIATQLGISTSTVHQRLTGARRTLGVSTSLEAARILAEAERADPYEGVIYDPIALDTEERSGFVSLVAGLTWPWATERRPVNDMTLAQTIVTIVLLAMAIMAATGLYFIGVGLLGKQL